MNTKEEGQCGVKNLNGDRTRFQKLAEWQTDKKFSTLSCIISSMLRKNIKKGEGENVLKEDYIALSHKQQRQLEKWKE